MKNTEVTPIELEKNRAAAVQLLFDCSRDLLLKGQLVDHLMEEKDHAVLFTT